MKHRMQKWMFSFAAICGVLGMILGQLLNYITKGYFSVGAVLGSLTGAIIIVIINIIKVRGKKDKTPDLDERTVSNMLKFYTYSSHVFLGLLFILLAIISIMDVQNVPVSYLWILIITYMCISGIGGLIAKWR